MKISIITVVYNNVITIRSAIESVLAQDYSNVEYIIVDGASTDGTLEVIKEYGGRVTVISEKDKGLYDAMNKGIHAATGDIVGILNSDDFFYDNTVLTRITAAFADPEVDATIADIVFVKEGSLDKVLRKYSSKKWTPSKFAWGYMPPHPSFFVKRSLFNQLGFYKMDYKIAADYELLIRYLLVNAIQWKYLPMITTKMRMGGASTRGIKSIITLNKEIARGCKENGIYSNYVMIYLKYFFKPFEFVFK